MWWKFGKILTDRLIYSLNVICKQILDVQTYRTSCLFSLSALQFEASTGIQIGWKTGATKGGSVCFFWTHIRTPLKRALLERTKDKDVWSISLTCCSAGCSAQDMRKQWRQMLHRVETGPRTALFHWVTSAFGHTAAHSTLWLTYYSLCACACVTYLFTVGLQGMKRDLHFGSNLAWPHTTRNVGKYISVSAPTL